MSMKKAEIYSETRQKRIKGEFCGEVGEGWGGGAGGGAGSNGWKALYYKLLFSGSQINYGPRVGSLHTS